MKSHLRLRTNVVPTLFAVTLCLGIARAADNPPLVVERVCSGCHGLEGNYGWQQVPRLAGQNAVYMEAQFQAYRLAPTPPRAEVPTWLATPAPLVEGARDDRDGVTYMVGISKALGEKEGAEAAAWYASRQPAPGTPGDPALVAQGKELFEKGAPDRGIPACQGCHGPSGQGNAQFPRIAGQYADYLQRQLRALQVGQRTHFPPMATISRGLTPDELRAVTEYVQSL
jgi:cytochrome c553